MKIGHLLDEKSGNVDNEIHSLRPHRKYAYQLLNLSANFKKQLWNVIYIRHSSLHNRYSFDMLFPVFDK